MTSVLTTVYHYDFSYAYYMHNCSIGRPVLRSAGQTLFQKRRAKVRRCHARRLGRICHVQSNVVMDAMSALTGVSSVFDAIKDAYFQKLIEDIIMMVYGLSTAKTMVDVMFTLINFVKLRIEGPVTRAVLEKFIFPFFDEHCMEVQSGEYELYGKVQNLRNLIEGYDQVWEIPIVKKFYRFTMFCLSYSLFENAGITMDKLMYNKIEQEAIRREFNKRSDFIMCILDTAVFVVERGMQCKMTGSLDPLLHSSARYQEWYDKCTEVVIKSKHLGNAEAFETTYHQFVADLEDCIEKGNAIVKASYKQVGEIRFIKSKLVELQTIKADLVSKRAAGQMREAPLAFLIFGPSSIAKSTFQEVLFQAYGKLKGLPTSSEFKFTVNYFEEFTSNFNTSKWCVNIDDAAWQHASIKTVDPSLVSIINIVNNMPLITNQAALEDKGKIPMRPKLVLCSTNTIDLNAHAYFACPLAVQRRFPFIICPSVKEQFRGKNKDGQKVNILDSELAAAANVPGQWPNFWDIEIKRVVPAQDNSVQGIITDLPNPISGESFSKFTEMNDFLVWYKEVVNKFTLVQSNVMSSMKSLEEMDMCTVTMQNKLTCSHCLELQSGHLTTERPASIGNRFYDPGMVSDDESVSIELNSSMISQQIDEIEASVIEPEYYGMESDDEVPEGVSSVPEFVGDNVSEASYAYSAGREEAFNDSGLNLNLHEEIFGKYYAPKRVRLQGNNEGPLDGFSDFIEEWLRIQNDRAESQTMWGKFQKQTIIWMFRLYLNFEFVRTCTTWAATLPVCRNVFWAVAKDHLLGVEEGRIAIALLGQRMYRTITSKRWETVRKVVLMAAACWVSYKGTRLLIRFMRRDRDDGKTASEWGEDEVLNNDSKRKFRDDADYQNKMEADNNGAIEEAKRVINQDIQGAIYSKDEFVKDNEENVWKREDYQTTTFDVSPAVLADAANIDEFSQRIYNNLYFSKCRVAENVYRPGKVLNICGHIYMTNNHNLPENGDIELELCREAQVAGVTSNVKLILRQSDVIRDRENDLCFFEVFNNPPGRDLRKYFALPTFGGVANGLLVGRGRGGDIEKQSVSNIHSTKLAVSELQRELSLWGMHVEQDTVNGDCGKVLIMKAPVGNVIVGMHVMGGRYNTAYSLRINTAILDKNLKHFKAYQVQSGEPVLSTPTVNRELTPMLHKNSTLRWMADGSAHVYGSFTDFRARMNSKVCVSYLGDKIRELRGWPEKFGRPTMKSWMPWHLAMKDIFAAKTNYNRKYLEMAKTSFTRDILSKLKQKDLNELQVLSDRAAVNGIAGVKFIDKMNFNTSLGFPWKKSKRFEMNDAEPTSDQPDAKTFTAEIWDRVRDCEDKYRRGIRYMPVFTAHLKDEAMTLAKIEAGKVRVFAGGPTDWCIVVRKRLLSFIRVMMKNRFIFEAAPGTVAQSLEWEEIRNHLTQFGADKMVAGDYGKFDKKMLPDFILAAYDIIIEIHRAAGWSDEDLLVLKCIAEDTAYPLIDFDGDLIEFFGSNPSGHPLTVIINSLVNSLYQRYAYIMLNPEQHCEDFQENVALMTYGDDNAFGVSSRAPWFNHTAIQAELERIGVTYTMADKEAKSVPFIHIDEISFLKRTWRFDEDLQSYLCPLEEASIQKMLTIWLPSKTICPEAQMIAVIESAVNEWFFYGRKKFEVEREFLMSLIDKRLKPFVGPATFPTWDDLAARFKENSKNVEIFPGKPWSSTRDEGGRL